MKYNIHRNKMDIILSAERVVYVLDYSSDNISYYTTILPEDIKCTDGTNMHSLCIFDSDWSNDHEFGYTPNIRELLYRHTYIFARGVLYTRIPIIRVPSLMVLTIEISDIYHRIYKHCDTEFEITGINSKCYDPFETMDTRRLKFALNYDDSHMISIKVAPYSITIFTNRISISAQYDQIEFRILYQQGVSPFKGITSRFRDIIFL